jgi:hypothetical protein
MLWVYLPFRMGCAGKQHIKTVLKGVTV